MCVTFFKFRKCSYVTVVLRFCLKRGHITYNKTKTTEAYEMVKPEIQPKNVSASPGGCSTKFFSSFEKNSHEHSFSERYFFPGLKTGCFPRTFGTIHL